MYSTVQVCHHHYSTCTCSYRYAAYRFLIQPVDKRRGHFDDSWVWEGVGKVWRLGERKKTRKKEGGTSKFRGGPALLQNKIHTPPSSQYLTVNTPTT